MSPQRLRAVALLAVCCFAVAACGQREELRQVALSGAPAGSAGTAGPSFADEGFTGDAPVAEPGGVDAVAGDGGGVDTTGGAGADVGAGTGTQSADGPAPAGRPGPARAATGDSTGVTDTTIKIGVHIPLTGAAPLPMDSLKRGSVQYWNFRGPVAGRKVEVVMRDDQYNASKAAQVCQELIEREKVFILVGGDGVDQVNACSRIAEQAGVPYITVGADYNDRLRSLWNYFAISQTHYENASLVLRWIEENAKPSNNKIAMMDAGFPGHQSAFARFEQMAKAKGYEVLRRRFQSGPSDGQWLIREGIQVAYPLMTAGQFLELVRSPGGDIQWVGSGFGANVVAEAGCVGNRPLDGAMMLTRWPGMNQIDKLDPNFRKAGGQDDLELWFWGKNKILDAVFNRMNGNFTREAFIEAFLGGRIKTNVYADQVHRRDFRFGATSSHVLIADCDVRQFVGTDDGLFYSDKE